MTIDRSDSKKNHNQDIKNIYLQIKDDIEQRLNDFARIWETGSEYDLFSELVFCLLTPQAKAKVCWDTVLNLQNKNLLLEGTKDQLSDMLNCVRFKNNKAINILEAQKLFIKDGQVSIKSNFEKFNNTYDKREWLVENIRGMGYKEASHFLRNIGFGEGLAILDRHILKNLKLLGVIEDVPNSMSKMKYLEIENKMKKFSERIKVPMDHLDIVLWYKETGEIFK